MKIAAYLKGKAGGEGGESGEGEEGEEGEDSDRTVTDTEEPEDGAPNSLQNADAEEEEAGEDTEGAGAAQGGRRKTEARPDLRTCFQLALERYWDDSSIKSGFREKWLAGKYTSGVCKALEDEDGGG